MVSVYLASFLDDGESRTIEGWRRLASLDESGRHRLAERPEDADVVLFAECHVDSNGNDWSLGPIRSHRLVQQMPDKVLLYNERDHPWCALPGIYVSMPRRYFDHRFQRAGAYWNITDPYSLVEEPDRIRPRYLFSFVGSASHPCRRAVLALDHPEGSVRRIDDFLFFDRSTPTYGQRRREFAETVLSSSFVLCPRGQGTASIRLFEVMAAGRAPVVISDQWVPPEGVDWSSCSVRWPENDLESLPRYLEEHRDQAVELGRRAREAWEERYSPRTWWSTTGDLLADLLGSVDRSAFDHQRFERGRRRWQVEGVHRQAELRTTASKTVRRLRRRMSARWSYLDLAPRPDRAVLVVSSGRSGSTWMAETLNWDNRWRVIFEPFDGVVIPSTAGIAYRFLPPDDPAPEAYRIVDTVLAGRLRNWWADNQNRKRIATRRLVKEIRITNLVPWLARRFPEVPIVYLIRHPLAVADSRMQLDPDHAERSFKWWAVEPFEKHRELWEGPLLPYADLIKTLRDSDDWMERFVLRWCMENLVPISCYDQHRALVVFYEDVVTDPEPQLRRILARLGLRFDPRILEGLHVPSAHSNQNRAAPRDPVDRISAWSEGLDPSRRRHLLDIVSAFGLGHVYGEDPTPLVDPEHLASRTGEANSGTGGTARAAGSS
jgi:hypothetical protein